MNLFKRYSLKKQNIISKSGDKCKHLKERTKLSSLEEKNHIVLQKSVEVKI